MFQGVCIVLWEGKGEGGRREGKGRRHDTKNYVAQSLMPSTVSAKIK